MATPVSRATSASFAVDGPGIASARSKSAVSSRWQKYWVRNSSGRQTIFAPSRAASRIWSHRRGEVGLRVRRPCASAPGPPCICAHLPSSPVEPSCSRFIRPCSKADPGSAELASTISPLHAMRYSSRISTAAAMVVVHLPRLSPTADCVTLLVRTILLEMR